MSEEWLRLAQLLVVVLSSSGLTGAFIAWRQDRRRDKTAVFDGAKAELELVAMMRKVARDEVAAAREEVASTRREVQALRGRQRHLEDVVIDGLQRLVAQWRSEAWEAQQGGNTARRESLMACADQLDAVLDKASSDP